jgi:hypothetical protein
MGFGHRVVSYFAFCLSERSEGPWFLRYLRFPSTTCGYRFVLDFARLLTILFSPKKGLEGLSDLRATQASEFFFKTLASVIS